MTHTLFVELITLNTKTVNYYICCATQSNPLNFNCTYIKTQTTTTTKYPKGIKLNKLKHNE